MNDYTSVNILVVRVREKKDFLNSCARHLLGPFEFRKLVSFIKSVQV